MRDNIDALPTIICGAGRGSTDIGFDIGSIALIDPVQQAGTR